MHGGCVHSTVGALTTLGTVSALKSSQLHALIAARKSVDLGSALSGAHFRTNTKDY